MKRRVVAVGGASGAGDGSPRLNCGHRWTAGHGSTGNAIAGSEVDCAACDRRELPDTTTPGRRTPDFVATTVPRGLLADHRTTAWAMLVVDRGTVRFTEPDPSWECTATPDQPVVIVPDRKHHVTPSADAQFAVQFFDLPQAKQSEESEPPEPGSRQ